MLDNPLTDWRRILRIHFIASTCLLILDRAGQALLKLRDVVPLIGRCFRTSGDLGLVPRGGHLSCRRFRYSSKHGVGNGVSRLGLPVQCATHRIRTGPAWRSRRCESSSQMWGRTSASCGTGWHGGVTCRQWLIGSRFPRWAEESGDWRAESCGLGGSDGGEVAHWSRRWSGIPALTRMATTSTRRPCCLSCREPLAKPRWPRPRITYP